MIASHKTLSLIRNSETINLFPPLLISIVLSNNMKYQAFISYSHSADSEFAPILHTALQKIAKPIFKVRALNVYRDLTTQSATHSLTDAIKKALSQSDYLILLASPAAAKSQWVKEEIDYWLNNKSPETMLLGLTEGNIIWNSANGDFDWDQTDAIPIKLRGVFQKEPLYIDFRGEKESTDLSLNNPDFKKNAARLAAAVHGKNVNDLIGEDVRLQKRVVRLRNSAITVLVMLLFSTLGLAWLSNQNAKQAQQNAQQAQRNAEAEQIQRQQAEKNLVNALTFQIGVLEGKKSEEERLEKLALGARLSSAAEVHKKKTGELQLRIDSIQHEIMVLNSMLVEKK